MRKLTGYIGALIIVFALMGSILAGYALNVNGSSSVINEYEKVTDVSGLYSHSQEPNYIDYNPASNYIGYNVEQSDTFTINNNSSLNHSLFYKLYKGTAPNCSWNNSQYGPGAFYVNGGVVSYSTAGDQVGITAYRIVCGETVNAFVWQPDGTTATAEININGGRYWSANFTISYSNNNVVLTLIDNGNVVLSSSCSWLALPSNSGDYAPVLNGNLGYYQYNNLYTVGSGQTINTVDEWNGQPVYNLYSVNNPGSNNWAFVPKTVDYQPIQDKGINYTESSRINNYPIETDYVDTGQTITSRVNLTSVSATDYWTSGRVYVYEDTHYYGPGESYKSIRYMPGTITGYSYRLSEITDIEIIATTANYIRIDAPVTLTDYSFTDNNIFFDDDPYTINFRAPSGNWAVLVPFANVGQQTVLDFNSLANQYVYYYPDTGKCELYNSAGVKQGTYDSLDQLYVIFVNTDTLQNDVEIYEIDNLYSGTYRYEPWNPVKTAPFINLTYETGGTVSTIHYADITKGFSIKDDNTANVIWDNEYSNGNIQILFRADNVLGTYHNDIIVGDNALSVDYNNNRYSVTLNGAAPTDIGTWRNIIINLDFRNGTLSVIPVRTFNSYTNIEMDTASIFIGDLTNPAPTNTIEWAPTVNSLMFNVYSTAVFMNTYGVVMVNPSLNITDYFTDLNNFYRLRLYNFGVLGDTVTVNGITGNVSNNVLSINGQSIQIKEMSITYADGHAYISDSNADIDLGEISDNNISMTGAWYFETDLSSGYTSQKMVYEWDWSDFILNNTQFCIMYMGIALIGLIVARHYCTMSITDYIVLVASFAIALTVQVIA